MGGNTIVLGDFQEQMGELDPYDDDSIIGPHTTGVRGPNGEEIVAEPISIAELEVKKGRDSQEAEIYRRRKKMQRK